MLAIAWVPSLILLLVGLGGATVFARQSINEDRFATSYADSVRVAAKFVAADQRERKLTVAYLLDQKANRSALDAQRIQTNIVMAQLPALLKTIQDTGSDSFFAAITESGQDVAFLPDLRKQVDLRVLTPRAAAVAYTRTLAVFHEAFETLATSAATARIAAEYQLTADLFRVAEWRSESETLAQAAYSPDGLSHQDFGVYLDRVGGYRSLLATTVPRLPAAEKAGFQSLTASTNWQQLTAVEHPLLHGVGQVGETVHKAGPLPIGQSAWDAASADVSQKLIDQYLMHVTYSTDVARDHAHELLLRSVAVGSALLLLSLLVFVIVTRMSTRMIRRLRRLQNETLEAARQRLPTIVERLGRGERVDIDLELPPLDHGTDEIGQVADAFNQAQRTAVEAAAKEAETRAGTSKVFRNIAHRSQILAHRQLKLLDQAERTQEDPDQLSLLFQLDHLSTRARRNAENLIILGGGQPGRRWRNPVPLQEVVRSAVGEAETYTGITVGRIPQVSVVGAAVADVIHLLAELVDNATSFSPPTAGVEVRSHLVGRGVVVEIEDQGLGIEPEPLTAFNQMLHEPPDFSVMALSDEPRLGLFVVTQLAARHDIRVTLSESPTYGGIRAIVLVPLGVITSTEAALTQPELAQPELTQTQLSHPQLRQLGRLSQPRIGEPGPRRPQLSGTEPAGPGGFGGVPGGLPSKGDVVGGALPTRKTRRLISPAADPYVSSPRSAPESPSGESQRQTSEIPVITANIPTTDQANHRPALPRRVRQAHLAPQLMTDRRSGTGPRSDTDLGGGTEVLGSTDVRAGAEVHDGTAADISPDAEDQDTPDVSLPSAESVRDRFAGLQLGTRMGREADPNSTG